MFDRCITCDRLGQECVPNLLALPWPELLSWWKKRQAHLGWTNQVLSDHSNIPVGTINRIKSGEDDARYSTMRSIIHALMGSHSIEFTCQQKLDQELAHIETMERKCAELTEENEALVAKMKATEELHRKDVAAIRAEYREQIEFLKGSNVFLREQIQWQHEHDKKE